MSDYFDLLEAELRAAVPRAVTGRSLRRRPIRNLLPAALGAAVAAAVVALGIALLGHRAHTSQAPEHASTAPVPTLRQLLDSFATLRRAQTAADRAWQPVNDPSSPVREVPQFTRLVRTLHDGTRVFLTVERFVVPQPGQPAGSYLLNVQVIHGAGPAAGTSFGPHDHYAIFPFALPIGAHRAQRPSGYLWTSLVPDGVAAVRWTFACRGPAARCAHSRPITVSVPVLNNIAVTTMPATACGPGAANCQPATVVWYGTSLQRVVARFTFSKAAAITAPPFVLRKPVPPRPARDMLAPNGIGGVRFGQRRATVVVELDRLLGVRAGPYRPGGLCNFDHTITWQPHRSPDGELSLIGYFAHGRLVGYEYDTAGRRVTPRRSTHGPLLATSRGLTVGDTLERGRRLYGSAFKISAAQGGSWSVDTNTGRIDGYASDVPRAGNLNAVKVQTIDAGDVGCPAEAP